MNKRQVMVERQGTSWGGWKRWNCEATEILGWLSSHGYKAYRAGTTANGERVCYFRKPNCKTEYRIYC